MHKSTIYHNQHIQIMTANERQIIQRLKELQIFDDDLIDRVKEAGFDNAYNLVDTVHDMSSKRFLQLTQTMCAAICNTKVDWHEFDKKAFHQCIWLDTIVVNNSSIIVNKHTPISQFLQFLEINCFTNIKAIDEATFCAAYKKAKLEIEKQFYYMKDDNPLYDDNQLFDIMKHMKLVKDSIENELQSDVQNNNQN